MKRTIIALATVVTATLIYQHPKQSVASDPIPPSLIGEWEDKGHKNYSDTLRLNPDGSYYEVYNTYTSESVYSQCTTTNSQTDKGSFTVKGNEITFHTQTSTVENFAGCVWGPMAAQTSLPKTYKHSNHYMVISFSLQNNGQTLELTQTGGNVKSVMPHEIYQKSSS